MTYKLRQVGDFTFRCEHCQQVLTPPSRLYGRPLALVEWREDRETEHRLCAQYATPQQAVAAHRARVEEHYRAQTVLNAERRLSRLHLAHLGIENVRILHEVR